VPLFLEFTIQHVVADKCLPMFNAEYQFHFIFDYLLFCSIPPDSRRNWGQQMSRFLKADGKLLTLMFPYSETKRLDNPRGPFPVSLQDYREALCSHKILLHPDCPYGVVTIRCQAEKDKKWSLGGHILQYPCYKQKREYRIWGS
jgi:hypothetical protein